MTAIHLGTLLPCFSQPSGVAGSGLEGFPKQWWPEVTGSPKGRAFLGGSGGMLPRKILQTEVSEIAILTTFQLQTTHKSPSVLMDFNIKTW